MHDGRRTLRSKGMGACKLVKNEVMLGRLPVIVRYPLAQPINAITIPLARPEKVLHSWDVCSTTSTIEPPDEEVEDPGETHP